MKTQIITVLAYACAITTVFLQRVVQPAALMLLAYIEELLVPETPQLALAHASNAVVLTPVETAVKPAKPRAAKRRKPPATTRLGDVSSSKGSSTKAVTTSA